MGLAKVIECLSYLKSFLQALNKFSLINAEKCYELMQAIDVAIHALQGGELVLRHSIMEKGDGDAV